MKMLKIILWLTIIFLFSSSIEVYSQKKFNKYFSFDVFYEQNRSYRILTFGHSIDIQREWFQERKTTENPVFSSKFGIHILYHLSPKWALKSGLSFANYGRIDHPTNLTVGFEKDTIASQMAGFGISNPIEIPNEENRKYLRKRYYLELPILAHFLFPQNNFFSHIDFGIILSNERFNTTKTLSALGDSTTKWEHQKNRFNLGIESSFGIKIFETKKLTFSLMPSFSFYLLNPKNQRFKEKYYSYGLRLQLALKNE